ncbi:hypothetical protein T484DRAFT_1932471, partial [Baffinella frigidus]
VLCCSHVSALLSTCTCMLRVASLPTSLHLPPSISLPPSLPLPPLSLPSHPPLHALHPSSISPWVLPLGVLL